MRLPNNKQVSRAGQGGLHALGVPAVAAALPQGGLMPQAVRPSVDWWCILRNVPNLLGCIRCGSNWGCWAECAGSQLPEIMKCLR